MGAIVRDRSNLSFSSVPSVPLARARASSCEAVDGYVRVPSLLHGDRKERTWAPVNSQSDLSPRATAPPFFIMISLTVPDGPAFLYHDALPSLNFNWPGHSVLWASSIRPRCVTARSARCALPRRSMCASAQLDARSCSVRCVLLHCPMCAPVCRSMRAPVC